MPTIQSFTTLWSAMAQVIPVLALAFVLEARQITRRYSKKRFFRNRKTRIAWSLTFAVLVFLLPQGLIGSILALTFDSEQLMTPFYWYVMVSAILGIYLTIIILILIPVSSLANGTVRDVRTWLILNMPWGQVQRARRSTLYYQDRNSQLLREIAGVRLDILIQVSARLVLAHRMLSHANGAKAAILAETPPTSPDGIAERRKVLSALDQTAAKALVEIESHPERWSKYVELKDDHARQKRNFEKRVKRLKKLDKMTKKGGSPADFKQYRRNLRSLARG